MNDESHRNNQRHRSEDYDESLTEKVSLYYSGRLFISPKVREVIKQEAEKFTFRETGGALLGYRTDRGDVVAVDATGPGPKAKHCFSTFEPDTAYAQELLMKAYTASGGIVTYIGSWHTHPCSRVVPSTTDFFAMRRVVANENFRCPQPVLWIFRPEHPVSLLARRWPQDENILFLDQKSHNWSKPTVITLPD